MLALTTVASAAAAYTCSKLWAPGTLPSAAMMPVLVALIREGLTRPTEAVTRAVPVRGVVRSAGSPEEPRSESGASPGAATPTAPPAIGGEPPGGGITRRWRPAIITGLLGFLVAAVVLTVPELVAGGSASGGGRGTTFFGGDKRDKGDEDSREREGEPSESERRRTVTSPGRTVTVAPRTTPTTTTSPTQTAPAPTTTRPGAATAAVTRSARLVGTPKHGDDMASTWSTS